MDPLSIASSIAGLVSLADLVFRTGTKYVKGVKESRKECEELVREVKNVSILLHTLSLVAFDLESEAPANKPQHDSMFKAHHLHDCQQVLRRLEKSLTAAQKDFESTSGLNRLQRRLKWPFSSTETREILQELQRHQQTLNVALSSESLNKLRTCLSRQEDTRNRVADLQATAKEIVMDNRRSKVLQLFTTADPRSELEMNQRLRHPLTGLWLTEVLTSKNGVKCQVQVFGSVAFRGRASQSSLVLSSTNVIG
jgi:hypothetical protein